MPRFNVLALTAALSLLFVAGCNKADKTGADLKPAALVNGQAIAADQIQSEAEKIGPRSDAQPQTIANLVLKNVIDQELLAQEADKAKLAEKSDVQWKLAAARRQILAQAELEAMTGNAAAPTDAEIKAYYDGHPELFSHHKIYKLANLVVDTTPGNVDKVRELAGKNTDARTLAAALQAQGFKVGGQEVVKAAEELPKELLEKFSALKVGQSLTMEQAGKFNIVMLEGVQEQPVSLDQAKQSIGQYLINDKKRHQLETQLDKLRSQAKIEYRAPYAAAEQAKN
ncbi:MAG TPA: EpsD family peptidyl-prolyl cis-trans isomerase [Parasulfuritortus sp.]